jgi:hypothetical protein
MTCINVRAQVLPDLDSVVCTIAAVLHGQVPIEAGQPIPPPLLGGGIASHPRPSHPQIPLTF